MLISTYENFKPKEKIFYIRKIGQWNYLVVQNIVLAELHIKKGKESLSTSYKTNISMHNRARTRDIEISCKQEQEE